MAFLANISTFYPENIVSNQEIVTGHPSWTPEKVFDKLGIRERRVAGPNEFASDLAVGAVNEMIKNGQSIDDVDFLIYCTQSPDYLIPTTACIIHERLGMKKSVGALDINLGCSGYVYGLGLATGLLSSGQAKKVLLVTAETYNKFIAESDISNRLIFGDGATCTLLTNEKVSNACLEVGKFSYGTDGTGWTKLKSGMGGIKETIEDGKNRKDLFMNGPEVMTFALREVPTLLEDLIKKNNMDSLRDVNHFVFHQANKLMLNQLEKKLGLDSEKVHRSFENFGNTVSSTIPIVLEDLLKNNIFKTGETIALAGFGVGFSWGGVVLKS